MLNLFTLDLCLLFGFGTRLQDLLEELLLLLSEILNSAEHLLFVVLGLLNCQFSCSLWTLGPWFNRATSIGVARTTESGAWNSLGAS